MADSTISDDLLPQPNHNPEEYTDSPISRFYDAGMKMTSMVPSLELNYMKESPKAISTTYSCYNYDETNQYSHINQYMNPMKSDTPLEKVFENQQNNRKSQQGFVQIGNMVQIVPRDLDIKSELDESNSSLRTKTEYSTGARQEKSQIVQVSKSFHRSFLYFMLLLY